MSDDAESGFRSCSGCTACCYTHAVGEIKKEMFTACPSCESNVGCKVYETRPRACGAYVCAWAIENIGNDDERPDKVGVVCNTMYTNITTNDPPSVLMMEAWPGALAEPRAQAFIARVLADGTAICTGSRTETPCYQYHVLRSTMEFYGRALEEKNYEVVWHDE